MQGSNIKALLLDLSGVIYEGSRLIPGALETVQLARQRGLVLRFVTNTATKSAQQICRQLEQMGLTISADELFTAPLAAQRYVQQQGLKPYALVHPSIQSLFPEVGVDQINAVVLGDARDELNYANLNRAFRYCRQGARLIAIGMNRCFMDDEGLMLDAGAFVRALEWAAGVDAIIMGKPGREFFSEVVASTGFAADQCLMVGDDVEADVAGAVAAGLQGCLVRTGKFHAQDLRCLPSGAGVVGSVAGLLDSEFFS